MITKRKSRYILVESSSPMDERAFDELSGRLHVLLGSFSQLDASPKAVVQYSPTLFAIRTNRGFEESVVLALAFVRNLSGRRIGLYTLKTSGTLRSLYDYARRQFGPAATPGRDLRRAPPL